MGVIAIAGGTGQVGREVAAALVRAGHQPRILSRRARDAGGSRARDGVGHTETTEADWAVVDYRTGAGLTEALTGADGLVVATGAMRDALVVRALARAASRASNPNLHIVYISIVGIDDVPMPYYAQKRVAERATIDSGLPWTILRATQFHTLAATMIGGIAKSPLMVLPKGVTLQPISHVEVSARLAELVVSPAAGRLPDLGGPQVLPVTELARTYLDTTGTRRRVLQIPLPGRMMRALRAGGLTCPQHAEGVQTFAEFLRGRNDG